MSSEISRHSKSSSSDEISILCLDTLLLCFLLSFLSLSSLNWIEPTSQKGLSGSRKAKRCCEVKMLDVHKEPGQARIAFNNRKKTSNLIISPHSLAHFDSEHKVIG